MAHFLLGNYEMAALVFSERIVLMPETDIGRAWLAASWGHVGQLDEARAVWADLMKIDPALDIAAGPLRFLTARGSGLVGKQALDWSF